MPSGRTKPWIEHGTPSRNGITRTRSQRGAKKPNAAAWDGSPGSSRTQRTKLPPPLKPSRASPDHTAPSGPATSAVAAASAPRVDRHDPVRRPLDVGGGPESSASSLSSSARNGRGPAAGDRPAEDRLVGGHERGGEPEPARSGVEGLDGVDGVPVAACGRAGRGCGAPRSPTRSPGRRPRPRGLVVRRAPRPRRGSCTTTSTGQPRSCEPRAQRGRRRPAPPGRGSPGGRRTARASRCGHRGADVVVGEVQRHARWTLGRRRRHVG